MTRGLFTVAALENKINIAAPAAEVFDCMADIRNEPRWNPQLLDVQMVTPEPMGVGTRFRVTFGRGVGEALIEDIQMDRPRSWTAVSRSRILDAQTNGRIDDVVDGSRLTIRIRLNPHGILRPLTPALGWWMHRTWDKDLQRVKALLEHDASTAAQSGSTDDACIDRVPVPDLCALWAETTTAPMNIALIGVVEGAPLMGRDGALALDRIRSSFEARLPRAPMLLRTLRPTRIGQGPPAWVDAQRLDIAEHVVLAPADRPLRDEDDFLDWCAQRSVIPLDRTRPLWRLDVVPGLPGGRVGIVLVLHHVVADGLRGVVLVTSLLDPAPDRRCGPGAWRPKPAPTGMDLIRDNLRRRREVVRRFGPSRCCDRGVRCGRCRGQLEALRPPRRSRVRSGAVVTWRS